MIYDPFVANLKENITILYFVTYINLKYLFFR